MKKPILIEIFIWTILLTVIFGIGIFTYSKFVIEPNIYNIHFKDIDGITKGSPVRFMGINIGYVRKLKPKDKFVNVEVIITKKDMKIPNGTRARVEFYGLGASKSIELMPPDGSCNVGILTNETIRLHDVAHEAISIVSIIEVIEKYTKNINEKKLETVLKEINALKDDRIKTAEDGLKNIKGNFTTRLNVMKTKQNEIEEKIEKIDENVEKLNQFIKN